MHTCSKMDDITHDGCTKPIKLREQPSYRLPHTAQAHVTAPCLTAVFRRAFECERMHTQQQLYVN